VKGAPEAVLAQCTHHRGEGQAQPLTEVDRTRELDIATQMAGEGLRVLLRVPVPFAPSRSS